MSDALQIIADISALGLGTAESNTTAAVLVASGSFSKEATMLILVFVFAVMELVILGPIAGELGKRSQAAASTATSDAMVSEK
jgi:hypothetical protein